MNFKQFLSPKRIAVDTPDNIVDENGKVHFGTFKSEFPNMDFLKVDHPSMLPNVFNKTRLSLWEAAEINFGKYLFLTAVCNMTIFGTALTILYDTEEKKCIFWQEMLVPGNRAVIAKTLLDGEETYTLGSKVKVSFINNFQDGEALLSGRASDKEKGDISYSFKFKRVSLPSIVSIPFGENQPLYSQKDLFAVEGSLEVNGERFQATDQTVAIIDDHKGYYPRKSHYDWVTTLGKKVIDGKEQYFGFNLTRNQSIQQDDYNENLIWFEGNTTLLTPVVFHHESDKLWHVQDDFGMVDLWFEIGDEFLMKFDAAVMASDYHITFGAPRGYVCDPDGNKYELDGLPGIGEDKSLKF